MCEVEAGVNACRCCVFAAVFYGGKTAFSNRFVLLVIKVSKKYFVFLLANSQKKTTLN